MWSRLSARTVLTHRSEYALARGERTGVLITRIEGCKYSCTGIDLGLDADHAGRPWPCRSSICWPVVSSR